jgi:hypothetical protein
MKHVQMDSKLWKQTELLPKPGKEPYTEPVTQALIQRIRRLPTFGHAFKYSADFAMLEDKEIYDPLKIDASHWTKITKFLANPPADERFEQFPKVVQNDIPLIWWVERRGFDYTSLRTHRSDTERRLEAVEKERDEYKRALELAISAGRRK